ncbi:flotillin-like protein FloA [bacterium]|nr:flotillin-like protein FloA [bacterium]
MELSLAAIVGIVAVLIIISLIILLAIVPIPLWIAARAAGVKVRIFKDLVGMRLRRVSPSAVINPQINATKAGLKLKLEALEAHFLARGHVPRVVNALIAADKAGIDLTFERATAIDLAGRDVFEAVQVSVRPRVIETPRISAVALDGIQLASIAKVTVRANIERLVGGAGDETIIARVGQGIVSAIGSSETYEDVLENPDVISQRVLSEGLDTGTAFEILSIDIADINVGENIGARLRTEQAEADLVVAQARAEERLAMAQAREQEMKAKVQQMRAKVVEAEAQVPKALAAAFRAGNLALTR